MPAWTRRTVLASAALAGVSRAALAQPAAPRVVALDWALATMSMALGVTPVGIAETRLYRDWVVTPVIPAGVAEVGLRTAPSFETLAALKPDLILVNSLDAGIRDRLETIAPTMANTMFTAAHAPLDGGRALTRAVGARLGRAGEAEVLIGATDARIAAARMRLPPVPRPLLPAILLDARHLCLYGRGSLYADVLGTLGLSSAFARPTSIWGAATVGIEALGDLPPCDLLLIEPVPLQAQRMMERPGLWTTLLAAKGARIHRLPPAWAFGDLTAAARFAERVADALVAVSDEANGGVRRASLLPLCGRRWPCAARSDEETAGLNGRVPLVRSLGAPSPAEWEKGSPTGASS